MGLGRLNGKRGIVTGAARGNGLAFARAFAAEGATVALIDSDADRLGAAQAEVKTLGGPTVSHVADVSNGEQVSEAVTSIAEQLGGIDVCVNNAGIISRHDIFDITEGDWDRVLDVNLKGTFLVGQAAARVMASGSGGSIINICSINAFSANPLTAHYCASKGGVVSLTKAMALALAGRGVRVNAIAPGPVDTELSGDRSADPGRLQATLARIALGRIAQPDDLAGAAIFLASAESAFMTGSVVTVDGGWLAK